MFVYCLCFRIPAVKLLGFVDGFANFILITHTIICIKRLISNSNSTCPTLHKYAEHPVDKAYMTCLDRHFADSIT